MIFWALDENELWIEKKKENFRAKEIKTDFIMFFQRKFKLLMEAKQITTKQGLVLDLNETKRNLTRKCLIYNCLWRLLHWHRSCYKTLSSCIWNSSRRKDCVFHFSFSDCNHKFSPEENELASCWQKVVVHFCVVNRIAHSLTKQVISLQPAQRVFPNCNSFHKNHKVYFFVVGSPSHEQRLMSSQRYILFVEFPGELQTVYEKPFASVECLSFATQMISFFFISFSVFAFPFFKAKSFTGKNERQGWKANVGAVNSAQERQV